MTPVVSGKWVQVKMSLGLDADGGAGTDIEVDGKKVSSSLSLPSWLDAAVDPVVILGIGWLDNSAPGDIYVDDVLIDAP